MDLNLIFIIELVLQISVVVILGWGVWIINQQVKIANEHFKSAYEEINEQFKTVNEQFTIAHEQVNEQFKAANEHFKTAHEQIHEQFKTVNEQFTIAHEQVNEQFKAANEHFKCIQTLDNQVQQLDKTVKEQYIWNKRSGALAYSLFKSDTLRETKIRLDHEFGTLSITKTLDLKTIKDKIDKKFETEVDIQTVLGHWENMALAISTGVADEDVAFSMVANQVGLYYNSFKEYIDYVRNLYPRRYAKFTWLYKRWKERLAGATPPPIADETTTENQ